MKDLWVEKYRPKTVDGYVFRDEAQKAQVKTWIKERLFHTCCLVAMLVLVKQHLQNCCSTN